MRFVIILSITIVVVLCLPASATVINIPDDYTTIQQGIEASANGDTVLVQPATYIENINFNGHNITLGSLYLTTGDTGYISQTVIDGNSSGSVVTFESGEDSTTMIAGFTIQHGYAYSAGGIRCTGNSNPVIDYNIIKNNIAHGDIGDPGMGGGIYCFSSCPVIRNNIINDNAAHGFFTGIGGGLYCGQNSDPVVEGNIIALNYGGGIACYYSSCPIIKGNIVDRNEVNGINCYENSNAIIQSNIICGNSWFWLGQGFGIICRNSAPYIINNVISFNDGHGVSCLNANPEIINTVIWGNSNPEISIDDYSFPAITYCDIRGGWEGEGNINSDPLFINPIYNNYNVYAQSPCINAGDPDIIDPDGTRSDIGLYYPEHPDCPPMGQRYYVSPAGNDTTGDGTFGNPYRTIQHAIDLTFFADTVIVETGIYLENVDFIGRNIVVTSNYLFSQDSTDVLNTIIDGYSQGATVTFGFHESNDAKLTGFTITGGLGSGIFCMRSMPVIDANRIVDNFGRGISCHFSNAYISNNNISDNASDSSGGGICCINSGSVIENNVIFGNSAAEHGGGIFNFGYESDLSIENNLIKNNVAGLSGGGINCTYANQDIYFNTIEDNIAGTDGGGIFVSDSYLSIRNNQIFSNTAVSGGGIYCSDSDNGNIYANTIIGNAATSNGGGINNYNSDYTFTGNFIMENSADLSGGGIYSAYSNGNFCNNVLFGNAASSGGGFCGSAINSYLINNTITGNSASTGAGAFVQENSVVLFQNAIFWENSVPGYSEEIYSDNSSYAVAGYCDIMGGYAGRGNIDANPLFRDPDNYDFHLMATYCGDPYDSPCIDAGRPELTDTLIDCLWGLGTTRSDMGAFSGGDSIPHVPEVISIPDDYATIQAGIYASYDYDTILVQPGSYLENLVIESKNIMLGSLFFTTGDTSFISSTIVDGDSAGVVINISNCNENNVIISGFTIKNGYSAYSYNTGGIRCSISRPVIDNCKIIENHGRGIYFYYSDATIRNCEITANRSLRSGAGIFCYSSDPVIERNYISGNSADTLGGGIFCHYSSPIIRNNVITNNHTKAGGAMCLWQNSHSIIINNVIYENEAEWGGGGICSYESNPLIVNTVFWADTGYTGENEIYISSGSPSITYCNVQGGWEGEGNIDVDPLFRDPENGDFHLMFGPCNGPYDSPCIDAGDPTILDSLLDCDWGMGWYRSDMGAYGGGDSAQVGIDDYSYLIPKHFSLIQNYPNPFNSLTTISYSLPRPSEVVIDIYDILGRHLEKLEDGLKPAGYNQVIWQADGLSSGMYFYRLQAGDFVETKKMVLLK